MSISFESALGIHEKALNFRTQRAEVLANNIANADTPNYKARDLDFKAVLQQQVENSKGTFHANLTNERHIAAEGASLFDESLKYRIPFQPSIDQNTVDLQQEQSTTPRTPCSSRPASPCSTASSKGWSAPCAANKRRSHHVTVQRLQHCRHRHERPEHSPEHHLQQHRQRRDGVLQHQPDLPCPSPGLLDHVPEPAQQRGRQQRLAVRRRGRIRSWRAGARCDRRPERPDPRYEPNHRLPTPMATRTTPTSTWWKRWPT